MIRLILAFFLVQALYCAEFPDLENHIELVWNNTNLTGHIDGSQTVSDKDNDVTDYILCGAFHNAAENPICAYEFAYAFKTESGIIYSTKGADEFRTKFVSKLNETYQCLKFRNPVGDFQEVYDHGTWHVSYSCAKFVPKEDFPWGIVIVVGVLVVVGAIFGAMYLNKKKIGVKEGETDGNSALLQNA